MTKDQTKATSRTRSPSLAALLSFLWPGLGQLYLRNRRLAAVFAVPSVLVIVLLAYGLRRGPIVFAVELFAERAVGLAAVAIVIGFGAWRLLSVIHAFLGANRSSARKVVDRAVLLALAAVIVVTHLGGGYYLLAVSDAGAEVFDTANSQLLPWATPSPSPVPGAIARTPAPDWTPAPTATPAGDGRVTILFTGASSGNSANLYDTIMVVSYNPKTNSIQMVSVPRDSASFQKLLANPNLPLMNHAISDIQPPGSTYKLVTGTGVLADKKLGLNELVLSKSALRQGILLAEVLGKPVALRDER